MDIEAVDVRTATPRDRDALGAMQALSMRVLGAEDYGPAAIETLIEQVGTMDDVLLEDGTYLVAKCGGETVGSGGWSTRPPAMAAGWPAGRRRTPVSVRRVYVHPGWARRGIARRLMARLEEAIVGAGFDRATLTATLTGVPFYRRLGYSGRGRAAIDLGPGLSFPVVPMERALRARAGMGKAA